MPAGLPLIWSYLAHALGAVPLLWLAATRKRGRLWWLIAAAYGVSFVADTGGYFGWPDAAGNFYPVSQAGLIGLALLDRRRAIHLLGVLMLAAVATILLWGAGGHDVVLVTVADLSIVWLAHLKLFGTALGFGLFLSFGLGLFAWYWYVADPGWWSWGGYQLTRLLGTGMFVYAAREA